MKRGTDRDPVSEKLAQESVHSRPWCTVAINIIVLAIWMDGWQAEPART